MSNAILNTVAKQIFCLLNVFKKQNKKQSKKFRSFRSCVSSSSSIYSKVNSEVSGRFRDGPNSSGRRRDISLDRDDEGYILLPAKGEKFVVRQGTGQSQQGRSGIMGGHSLGSRIREVIIYSINYSLKNVYALWFTLFSDRINDIDLFSILQMSNIINYSFNCNYITII